MQAKLQFVSSILNAKREVNENFREFEYLIEKDYKDFANQVRLKEELNYFSDLQAIKNELLRVLSLKAIANKSTIAVGGGFSAGKSQFISSFLNSKSIKLPIDVNPTTAIASYITHAQEDKIKGYSYNGGVVDIPLETYATLSHDFMKELGFNLKTILPRMAMQTPMPELSHICFIDTPGYNPSQVGSAAEDFDTAREYLINSNALIWMVGLDTNGTIPNPDLEFLEHLDLQSKKLYIVANKADLKPLEDLEIILDNFEDSLAEFGLEYEGISAYSATDKQEILYRKKNLFEFMDSVDKDIVSKTQIAQELNKVFLGLKAELLFYKNQKNQLKSLVNSLELDIMESLSQENPQIEERIQDLKTILNFKEMDQFFDALSNLRDKAFRILNALFVDIFGEGLKEIPKFEVEEQAKEGLKEELIALPENSKKKELLLRFLSLCLVAHPKI